MSKNMQIAVTVNPLSQGELERSFPKLARHLGYLDPALVQSNPSLYSLVSRLDKLLYAYDGTELREVLLRRRGKLLDLHKSIDGHLANWNLAQADKLLYEVEDIFEDMEGELS